jgi:hypothetical protein
MLNPFGARPSINEVSDYLEKDGKSPLKINDYAECIERYPYVENPIKLINNFPKIYPKVSHSRKSKKVSRNVSRKTYRKVSQK